MSFFQNPLSCDFLGNWILGDRKFSQEFRCPSNKGRSDEAVTVWANPPYDLSGNDSDGNSTDTLVLKFALTDLKTWYECSVDITASAASSSAVTPAEIVTALNADDTFSSYFVASLGSFSNMDRTRLLITQKKPAIQFRFFVVNGRAEEVLKFNKRAGVAELPTYFERHVVGNHTTYPDGQSMLVALDVGNNVDAAVVDNATDANGNVLGYDSGTVQEDYQLLKGRSGIFTFQKLTVDSSDRITQIIEYHAGAIEGDLARKISYTYTGAKTKPDQITEVPYTLTSGDLVTP